MEANRVEGLTRDFRTVYCGPGKLGIAENLGKIRCMELQLFAGWIVSRNYAQSSMDRIVCSHQTNVGIVAVRTPVADGVRDILKDCEQQGLVDELRQALGMEPRPDATVVRAIRDLVYELAGARNRDLAVDVLIYATGVAEFDVTSLRDYAARHGLTAEGFRKQVLAMQRRLGLSPRPMQHSDAN
jgi:hypothetical protein